MSKKLKKDELSEQVSSPEKVVTKKAARSVKKATTGKDKEAAKSVKKATTGKDKEATKSVKKTTTGKDKEATKSVKKATTGKDKEAAKSVKKATTGKDKEAAKSVKKATTGKDKEAAKSVKKTTASKNDKLKIETEVTTSKTVNIVKEEPQNKTELKVTKGSSQPAQKKISEYYEEFLTDIVFDDLDSISNEEILEKGSNSFKKNTVVTGQVIDINNDFVAVDINHKSIGLIPKEQFTNASGELTTKIGQQERVYLEQLEDIEGKIKLSKKKSMMLEVWEKAKECFEQEKTISGTIIEKTKGGMKVDIGITAFLPNSQIDLKPIANLYSLIGQIYDFKIIKYNKKKANIVLSRRALLELDRVEKRKKTLEKITEGSTVKGVVKNITKYGVFVDIGGIDGLLHITDMTWGRIANLTDFCKMDEEINVVILKMDLENNKVSLGLKQKTEDPWNSLELNENDIVEGTVTFVESYGIFVEIKNGVEGLVYNNEISWSKSDTEKLEKIKTVGNTIKVMVKEIDRVNRKIGLSIKALEPNIWKETEKKIKKGDVVKGVVRSITDYGIFVAIEYGIDGLIHNSDISWNTRGQDMNNLYKIGDSIKTKVLILEADDERLSLSIKHLTNNPWRQLENKIDVGDIVEGKIVFIENYGIFLEIYGAEGLLHHNKLSPELSTKKKLEENFSIGSTLQVKVLKLDVKQQKLSFSLPKSSKVIEKVENVAPVSKEKVENVAPVSKEKVENVAPVSKEKVENVASVSKDK